MGDTLHQLNLSFREYLPQIVAAAVILLLGWLVAVVVSRVLRSVLRRSGIDRRLNRLMGNANTESTNAGDGIGTGVFWLIMLIVLAAFFQTLRLTQITDPLNRLLTQIFAYAPRLVGALILLLIAWVVARILRSLVAGALRAARIDQRLGEAQGQTSTAAPSVPGTAASAAARPAPLSQTLAEVVYWLVFLLFLPAILSALQLPGILQPVQSMVDKLLAFLPNLVAAALILLIGWFVARLVQRIVSGLLAGVGVDRLAERVGLHQSLGGQGLSGVLGLVVFIFILIPAIIASLNALQLQSLSVPASTMLTTILGAIPNVFTAVVVLAIAYVVGRLVAGVVTSLLAGLGFDAVLERLGLRSQPAAGQRTPSELAGMLTLVAVMLFAAIEATDVLGFVLLSQLVADFTVLFGHILLGVIVFGVGLYFANLAARAIQQSGAPQAGVLALAARVAILVLVGAIALRQMGLANEIINLAFGLLLGAIAVAVAIAFGIGGREIAGRELQSWVEANRSNAAGRIVTPAEADQQTEHLGREAP